MGCPIRRAAGIFLACFAVALSVPSANLRAQLLIDGELGDWSGIELAWSAGSIPGGDGPTARSLSVAHDNDSLLIRLRLDRSLLLQETNPLVLLVAVDGGEMDECTRAGGPRLTWSFGTRRGSYCRAGEVRSVRHQDVGLVTAPTFASADFEIAVSRELFPEDRPLRVEVGGAATRYDFDRQVPPTPGAPSFLKIDPSLTRIVSHNLNRRFFTETDSAALSRVYRALAPDIWLLQEIRRPAAAVLSHLLRLDPTLADRGLRAAAAGLDHLGRGDTNVLVTSRPIVGTHPLGGSGAFLLDLDGSEDRLLIVVLSAPCCHRHEARQREVEQVADFVRTSRRGEGPLPIGPDTPVLLMGDANLVGPAEQRDVLLAADDPPLTDLVPRHLYGPHTFTWYGVEPKGYSPGRLDYAIHSAATLDVANAFVLFTPAWPGDALTEHRLEPADSRVSDHQPLVVDIRLGQ